MKIFRTSTLATVATAILLSSCASFYAQQSDVSKQIESWLAKDQYDKALDTIEALSPEHSEYQLLTNSVGYIEQRRQKYIQATLAQGAEYEPRQDWLNAELTLIEGFENLPNAPELKAQKEYYTAKRLDRLYKDNAAVLIFKSKYIITSRPHQESLLYNASNRFFAQQQFSDFDIPSCRRYHE